MVRQRQSRGLRHDGQGLSESRMGMALSRDRRTRRRRSLQREQAAAEFVARTYQKTLQPKDRALAIATARGGNVLGGGDWSPNRLVPDMVRALRSGAPLELRYPRATRPWRHVLDLCYAYLLLGSLLARGRTDGNAGYESA